MTSRRVKIIMLSSWVPNIVFLLVEVATVLLSDGVVVGSTHVRARCAIDGLMALEVARVSYSLRAPFNMFLVNLTLISEIILILPEE